MTFLACTLLCLEGHSSLGSCILFKHAKALLVWHLLMLVAQVSSLKAFHDLTVRIYFTLLGGFKHCLHPRVHHWVMVLIVLLPIVNGLLYLHVVITSEHFVNLCCACLILLFLAEYAFHLALWHTGLLLLGQCPADIQWQLSEKNQLVVVILLDRGWKRESRILRGIGLTKRHRLTLLDISVPLAHVQAITSNSRLAISEAPLVLSARSLFKSLIPLFELIYH